MAKTKRTTEREPVRQVGERAWAVMVPAAEAAALGAPAAAIDAGEHVVVAYFALDPANPEVRAGSGAVMRRGDSKGERGPLQHRLASVRFYPSVSAAHPSVRLDAGLYVDPRPEGKQFKAFVAEAESTEDETIITL